MLIYLHVNLLFHGNDGHTVKNGLIYKALNPGSKWGGIDLDKKKFIKNFQSQFCWDGKCW